MKKRFFNLMILALLLASGNGVVAQDQPFKTQEVSPSQQETQFREEFNKIFGSLNESEKTILKQHDAFNDALNLKNREEISAEEYYQRIIKVANDVKTGNVSVEEKRAIESGFTGRPVQPSQLTGCDPAQGYCLIVPIPGFPAAVTGPAQYIRSLYQFGLAAGALLAMAIIIYGGIKYTASAGNPSVQSDAKDRITSAVYGLILLLAATLILVTIDPALVLLKEPEITAQLENRQFSLAGINSSIAALNQEVVKKGIVLSGTDALENELKKKRDSLANTVNQLETAADRNETEILRVRTQLEEANVEWSKANIARLKSALELQAVNIKRTELEYKKALISESADITERRGIFNTLEIAKKAQIQLEKDYAFAINQNLEAQKDLQFYQSQLK